MFGTKASLAKIYGNSSFSSTTGNTPRSWRGVVYWTRSLTRTSAAGITTICIWWVVGRCRALVRPIPR